MPARKWLVNHPTAEGKDFHDEHDVLLEWKADDYTLEFVAVRGIKQESGAIGFSLDGANYTEDPELAPQLVSGSIRWDGCSHLYVGESGFGEGGYLHFCGQSDFAAFEFVLRRVRELALQHVDRLDNDVAGFVAP